MYRDRREGRLGSALGCSFDPKDPENWPAVGRASDHRVPTTVGAVATPPHECPSRGVDHGVSIVPNPDACIGVIELTLTSMGRGLADPRELSMPTRAAGNRPHTFAMVSPHAHPRVRLEAHLRYGAPTSLKMPDSPQGGGGARAVERIARARVDAASSHSVAWILGVVALCASRGSRAAAAPADGPLPPGFTHATLTSALKRGARKCPHWGPLGNVP